ncbi:MAG: catalase, partial [Pseudomonadota bacterium]
VHAFRFTNREGKIRHGRYRIHPIAGERHLEAAEAAARPADYLSDELAERFKSGPVRFRLMAQLAEDGDPVTDASRTWPETRAQVELGTVGLTSRRPDSDAAERSLSFNPARLVDGIEASGDPLIQARSETYAMSYRRRNPAA